MRISEWKAKGYVLETGRCYANDVFMRDIRDVEDGRVEYTDYTLCDGASIGRGSCAVATFIAWADREATEEEIDRQHKSDFQARNDAERLEEFHGFARACAWLTLKDPTAITDEMLIAEVERRGLAREGKEQKEHETTHQR